MNQIPFQNHREFMYNKKAILLIIILMIIGTIAGLILSYYFVDQANEQIQHFVDEAPPGFYNLQPLATSDIIIPTLGVIIVCISTFLLVGLIVVYLKVFMKSNSKYIVGLLFFLFPLFIQSIISINTLRSLFTSSSIPFHTIRESVGFGIGGLGGMLVILSIFEIFGLSILLYLSTE